MTPEEERASRALLFKLEFPPDDTVRDRRLGLIAEAIRKAVAEEREACAKVAESLLESTVQFATARATTDSGGDAAIYIECRFNDGMKYAAATLADDENGNALAHLFVAVLNGKVAAAIRARGASVEAPK